MPSQRVDLTADLPVNLTLTASLIIGRQHQGQHRGTDGPIYIAELTPIIVGAVEVDPTPTDIASAGFIFNAGDTFQLYPRAGSALWATAPKGGRLTIGDVI